MDDGPIRLRSRLAGMLVGSCNTCSGYRARHDPVTQGLLQDVLVCLFTSSCFNVAETGTSQKRHMLRVVSPILFIVKMTRTMRCISKMQHKKILEIRVDLLTSTIY
jgi:hypothetical protein